jgi:hypothetical protein
MEVRDIISIIAILVGPVTAVSITLWWQQRKEKRDAKMRLFITLMSYRSPTRLGLAPEWVTALNLIDMVFADQTRVLELWHQLFDLLHNPPIQQQQARHKNIEMLSEMAKVLGFRNFPQVQMDKYYYPESYEAQAQEMAEIRTNLLRVLANTDTLNAVLRKP